MPLRGDFNCESLKYRYGSSLISLPCGSCVECQKSYRKSWAVRCEFESKLYKDNCFITLTYDDSKRPFMLLKKDLQDFIKALRNRGLHFRYFGCGERGSISKREHFHLIIFGYIPDDLKFFKKSKSGYYLYNSAFIDSVWQKGFCTIQEFDSSCANYVAGYTSKKLGGDKDSFILMSTRPGIGFNYIKDNLDNLLSLGYVSKNGRIFRNCRYIDKVAIANGCDLSSFKSERIKTAVSLTSSVLAQGGYKSIDEYLANKKYSIKNKVRSEL